MRLNQFALATSVAFAACGGAPKQQTLDNQGEPEVEESGGQILKSAGSMGSVEKCVERFNSSTRLVVSSYGLFEGTEDMPDLTVTQTAHDLVNGYALRLDCDGVDMKDPQIVFAIESHNKAMSTLAGLVDARIILARLPDVVAKLGVKKMSDGGTTIDPESQTIFRKIDGKVYYLIPNAPRKHSWRQIDVEGKEYQLNEYDKMIEVRSSEGGTGDQQPHKP